MTPVVRDVRPDEIDDAVRLIVAVFQGNAPPQADASPEMRDAFARYIAGIADLRSHLHCADLLLARDAETITGAVLVVRPGAPATISTHGSEETWPPQWATLRLLTVAPAARGRGLGRALTEAAIRRARELGAPVLALHTTRDLVVARALYARIGWARVPRYDCRPAPELLAEAYALDL
jgi:GNAT superfamily N-acetyltransferase